MKYDNNSFSPYKYNEEVEEIVEELMFIAKKKNIQDKLDKALDEKLWISNPEKFETILQEYNSIET